MVVTLANIRLKKVGSLIRRRTGMIEIVIQSKSFGVEKYPVDEKEAELQKSTPRSERFGGRYIYRDAVIEIIGGVPKFVSRTELITRIKHFVLREEKAFEKIKKELRAYENLNDEATARRERIPEDEVRGIVLQVAVADLEVRVGPGAHLLRVPTEVSVSERALGSAGQHDWDRSLGHSNGREDGSREKGGDGSDHRDFSV